MGAKEKKSDKELQAMIMAEAKKRPEWNDIQDVSITKSVQTAPHHANWSAAFIMDGRRTAPGDAFRFATELAAKDDLA